MIINRMAKELFEDDAQSAGVSPDNSNASVSQGAAYNLSSQDPNANKAPSSTQKLDAAKNNKPGSPNSSEKNSGLEELRNNVSSSINTLASSLKGTSIEADVLRELNIIIKLFNGAMEKKNQSGIQFLK